MKGLQTTHAGVGNGSTGEAYPAELFVNIICAIIIIYFFRYIVPGNLSKTSLGVIIAMHINSIFKSGI